MRFGRSSHLPPQLGPPTKILSRHIKRRDWDGARLRTLTYPSDAHYRNKMTPMHLVCLYRAPLDLIEMLIDINPGSLLEQNADGWTPLHLTILHGGDEETVLLLIRRGGKMAASLQSPYVGSPLHLACRHTSSIAILEALVRANNEMATTPNEFNGAKPAEMIWGQFLRQHTKNFKIFDAVVGPDENGNDININHLALRDLIDRIKILLAAAGTEDKEMGAQQEPEEIRLHDLVSKLADLGDISPFLDIAVRLYPRQVSAMDQDGNYPLHLVAGNPETAPTNGAQLIPRLGLFRDPIEVLARSFPAAANTANRHGSYPLHLALKSGQRKWGTGLSYLVKACPVALERRDRETRLFPFQLAASRPVGNDVESLGTILELLLACPHVVQR